MRMTVPLILAAALAAASSGARAGCQQHAPTRITRHGRDDGDRRECGRTGRDQCQRHRIRLQSRHAPAVDETTAPAPEEKKGGFPWGVLGLLGLIGLIPSARRR